MSPRAAWRLTSLGFEQVHDYVAGKSDWLANGLPTQGPAAATPRALKAAVADVATCRPGERLADVVARVGGPGDYGCVVVNEERVVLGRVRPEALAGNGGASVDDVMEPGPTTVRADEPLEPLAHRMGHRNVPTVLVTTPDGRLLGLVRRESAEALLAEAETRRLS
jgi:CBS domain-containing protein